MKYMASVLLVILTVATSYALFLKAKLDYQTIKYNHVLAMQCVNANLAKGIPRSSIEITGYTCVVLK